MAEITLKATTGRELGSGPSKRIRAEGDVPGVVYGLDADPIPVTVEWRPLREALTTEAGLNALIDLDVDGDVSLTVVKELQRHPIKGNVLHIDFLRVSADAEITVEVPILLEGEARAVLAEGGTVDHLLYALSINAKPADIPNELTVAISDLQINGSIHVSDIALPKGVSTDVDGEETVVTGTQAHIAEEAAPAEGEGAEGEAAPAAEGGSEGDGEG